MVYLVLVVELHKDCRQSAIIIVEGLEIHPED
jgi:hypothetical protein